MPVLLLARGDKEGRELLRKALQARYGLGAPALEALMIQMKGRARTKLGPITTWTPLETTAWFRFPGHAHWDTTLRAVGVTLRTASNAYDGLVYRKRQNNDPIQVVEQPEIVRAARLRLNTAAAMLLTPLAEQFIELKGTGERSFEATNLETRDSVLVTLHEDYTVDTVSARCLNPEQNLQEQELTFQAVDGQISVNDLMLPGKVLISWNNVPCYEVTPVAVEINPAFDDALFRLENKA